MKPSIIYSHMTGRLVEQRGPINLAPNSQLTYAELAGAGFNFSRVSMDGDVVGPSNRNIETAFLDSWLPGTLRKISHPSSIDRVVGITTVGRWEDDSIKIRTEEPTAKAERYSDEGQIPLASYISGMETRDIVRFEQGFAVGLLSGKRQDILGYDETGDKRAAAKRSLDYARNQIGWFGDGAGTYGLLTDPSLPDYITTAGNLWGGSSKTFDQLRTDFNNLVAQLESQMGQDVPENASITFAIPTGMRTELTKIDPLTGQTFMDWMRSQFTSLRIVASAEMKSVNVGGLSNKDAFYLFMDSITGAGDDAGDATIIQAVPTQYEVLGSDQTIKAYIEDATAATAGIIVKRPYAFARMKNATT